MWVPCGGDSALSTLRRARQPRIRCMWAMAPPPNGMRWVRGVCRAVLLVRWRRASGVYSAFHANEVCCHVQTICDQIEQLPVG